MSSDEEARSEDGMGMLKLPPLTLEDLVELGGRILVPRPLPSRIPVVGDVWRARWDDVAVLVVLLGVERSQVQVAPCTFDVPANAPQDLPEIEHHPLYVSWQHDGSIPAITLDARFGAIAITRSPTTRNDADDRDDELSEELARLAGLHLADQGESSLPDLLATKGIQLPQLVEALKVPPATALKIRRGTTSVTPSQAKTLARLLAVTEETILHSNPRLPDELRADLQEYRHRGQLQRLAARQHLKDSEAWSLAAYGVLASAARHTGGKETGWHLRIDRYFESEGVARD